MASKEEKREWELPHLREAHKLPVSKDVFRDDPCVTHPTCTGLFLMAGIFRQLKMVCLILHRKSVDNLTIINEEFWSVKFYPYTEAGVDPVFAVVGGKRVSLP
jgi:hypothetical protein